MIISIVDVTKKNICKTQQTSKLTTFTIEVCVPKLYDLYILLEKYNQCEYHLKLIINNTSQ